MTIKEVLEKTTEFFKQKGVPSARLDAEILFGFALNLKRLDLYLNWERPLTEMELQQCRPLVKRRSEGEPVAYICGYKDFFNYRFKVGKGVLIPRPETELLVERALEFVKSTANPAPQILDLGTGTGCIALSLAKEIPTASVTAVDISEEAKVFFEENKKSLAVSNANFLQADAGQLLNFLSSNSFDLILANPPYIAEGDARVEKNVRLFEPSIALFSGVTGFEAIESWARVSSNLLRAGGLCLFEIGLDQGQLAKEAFEVQQGFSGVSVLKDYSGHDRYITAFGK